MLIFNLWLLKIITLMCAPKVKQWLYCFVERSSTVSGIDGEKVVWPAMARKGCFLYKSAWQGKKQAKLFEEDFLILTSHSISSHLPKLPFLHLNWWKDKETTVSKQSCKVRQKLQRARLRKTSLVQSVCMRQNQQKEAKNVHWQWRTKSFISIIAATY